MPTVNPQYRWWTFIAVGAVAGIFSGFFGVGGGIVMVPLLVSVVKLEYKVATVTSLAAIIPTATIGALGFAFSGSVPPDQLLFGLVIALGGIATAPLGTFALRRLNVTIVRWGFIALLCVTAVMVFVTLPSRDAMLEWSTNTVLGLLALGFIMGFIAGLLGVGGGLIVVPVLILIFGVSDLTAKTLSLVAMVPAAVSGTISSARARNFPLMPSATLGIGAVSTSLVGVWLATLVPVSTAQVLLAAFIVYAAVNMAFRARKTVTS